MFKYLTNFVERNEIKKRVPILTFESRVNSLMKVLTYGMMNDPFINNKTIL